MNSSKAIRCLIPIMAFIQTHALYTQEEKDSILLPKSTEKALAIDWCKTEWLGSCKFTIGAYASGKKKFGVNSSGFMIIDQRERGIWKTKLTIEVRDTLGREFVFKGQQIATNSGATWVENDRVLKYYTGIQSEILVEGDGLEDIRIIKGEIQQKNSKQEPWELFSKRYGISEDIRNELDGFLKNGERIILIEDHEYVEIFQEKEVKRKSYRYVENGKIYGTQQRFDNGEIWIENNLDPLTKSLILSVMAIF